MPSRLPFPAIDPVAIAIGPLAIRWYALAYVAGLLGGWCYARRLAADADLWGALRRPSRAGRSTTSSSGWPSASCSAAASATCCSTTSSTYLARPLGDPRGLARRHVLPRRLHRRRRWRSSLFARSRGIVPLALLDIAAVVAPIGLFFGRIANFINGELWGRVRARISPTRWSFRTAGPCPRHPSQLYEAFGEGLVLFVVLAVAVRRFGLPPARPRSAACSSSATRVARIVCEFFREPDAQLGYLFGTSRAEALGGGITMGMLLSLPMAPARPRPHRGWPRAAARGRGPCRRRAAA